MEENNNEGKNEIQSLVAASLLSAILAYLSLKLLLAGADWAQMIVYVIAYQLAVLFLVVLVCVLEIAQAAIKPSLLGSCRQKANGSFYKFVKLLLADTIACWYFAIEEPFAVLAFVLLLNLATFYALKIYRRRKLGE